MSTIKVNTIQNTSGVEQYTCKAWVNFNGTGTVAIRASGNVTSITDLGTGTYRVNFATAFPDVNYAIVGTCQMANVASGVSAVDAVLSDSTTTQSRVRSYNSISNEVDNSHMSVAFFR